MQMVTLNESSGNWEENPTVPPPPIGSPQVRLEPRGASKSFSSPNSDESVGVFSLQGSSDEESGGRVAGGTGSGTDDVEAGREHGDSSEAQKAGGGAGSSVAAMSSGKNEGAVTGTSPPQRSGRLAGGPGGLLGTLASEEEEVVPVVAVGGPGSAGVAGGGAPSSGRVGRRTPFAELRGRTPSPARRFRTTGMGKGAPARGVERSRTPSPVLSQPREALKALEEAEVVIGSSGTMSDSGEASRVDVRRGIPRRVSSPQLTSPEDIPSMGSSDDADFGGTIKPRRRTAESSAKAGRIDDVHKGRSQGIGGDGPGFSPPLPLVPTTSFIPPPGSTGTPGREENIMGVLAAGTAFKNRGHRSLNQHREDAKKESRTLSRRVGRRNNRGNTSAISGVRDGGDTAAVPSLMESSSEAVTPSPAMGVVSEEDESSTPQPLDGGGRRGRSLSGHGSGLLDVPESVPAVAAGVPAVPASTATDTGMVRTSTAGSASTPAAGKGQVGNSAAGLALQPKVERRLDISGHNRFTPRKDYPPPAVLFQVRATITGMIGAVAQSPICSGP